MGSSSSKCTTDVVQLEILKDHYASQEKVCGMAFKLCVDPPTGPNPSHTLTEKEVRCIREYGALYGDFQRKAMSRFTANTEDMMREMSKLQR